MYCDDVFNCNISLKDYTTSPHVNIISDNENVVVISDIDVSNEHITFNVKGLNAGTSTITVNIIGDNNKTLTKKINVIGKIKYSVEKIEGVSYSFNLNDYNYYENPVMNGSQSYALCKLIFTITEHSPKNLVLECISSDTNTNYNWGILSNIDTTLNASGSYSETDTNIYKTFRNNTSRDVIKITYPEATIGEHFIYVKYNKAAYGYYINDTFRFKVIS